jgi:crotonobetainyl-CoA:carnitine CoA-transferase CaiB-like acyl-CoA transferase
MESLMQDEHIQAVRLIEDMSHPSEGKIRMVRPPSRWSETQPQIYRHPPQLGEDTREVLAEAGYSESDIAEMIRCGSARTSGSTDA